MSVPSTIVGGDGGGIVFLQLPSEDRCFEVNRERVLSSASCEARLVTDCCYVKLHASTRSFVAMDPHQRNRSDMRVSGAGGETKVVLTSNGYRSSFRECNLILRDVNNTSEKPNQLVYALQTAFDKTIKRENTSGRSTPGGWFFAWQAKLQYKMVFGMMSEYARQAAGAGSVQ